MRKRYTRDIFTYLQNFGNSHDGEYNRNYAKKLLFSGKIYTAGKKFSRPPVVTVVTNLNSALILLTLLTLLVEISNFFYPNSTL